MATRAKDWLEQAEGDLQHAEHSRNGGHHDWACFASRQAAGMALKALHASLGQDVWGQGILKPMDELPAQIAVPAEFRGVAAALEEMLELA